VSNRIRFGVSTAAFFPKPLEETFQILDQQPWKHIEFMPQTPDECRPGFASKLAAINAGRLKFCAIHFPQILAPFLYNPYPAALEYGQRLCVDLGELTGALGCSSIVVHGPWENMSTGAFLDATLSNLRLLCDTCAKHDVIVAVENTPSSPLCRSPEGMLAFAKLIDHPNIGFTVDITHAYQLGQDPMIYINGLPEIAHIHASDFDTATEHRHTPPGDGVVNWSEIIAALLSKGFSGNFVLELLPKTLGDDPVKTLQQSAALLEPLFQN
jgi:sugar phosphate isomerase/epimerase